MRTYGRVYDDNGNYKWVELSEATGASKDQIYLTTLIQVLKLNLNESPFYANYGIPARPSVMQQIFPDFYVYRTQQQFAPYFASLIISKRDDPTPTYDVNVTFNNGQKASVQVPV